MVYYIIYSKDAHYKLAILGYTMVQPKSIRRVFKEDVKKLAAGIKCKTKIISCRNLIAFIKRVGSYTDMEFLDIHFEKDEGTFKNTVGDMTRHYGFDSEFLNIEYRLRLIKSGTISYTSWMSDGTISWFKPYYYTDGRIQYTRNMYD